MKYKNKEKNIAEIANDLNIDIALEGSIRKVKNRIRVTAQLIEAKTQEHLWAETYDKKLNHIFELQDDIAFNIAKELRITLLDIEKSNIEKRSTQNIEAYNTYLKGRYYWNMRTPENLVKGMEYFQYATEVDSNFALAHAGIADSYHLLCSYGTLPPKVGFPKAKEAALMAIKMDENLAEGYNALAAINLLYTWDWDACERAFKKAVELNPRNVQTYSWYALYFQIQKEFGRAFELVEKAITLDPLSAIARTDMGQVNYHAGNYKQAIEEYQKSLELDSNYVYTYAYLGQAYAMNGEQAAAEIAFEKAVHLTREPDPATLSGLAYVYALRGKTGQARSIIARLTATDNPFYIHPMYIASIYGALGEIDQAFDWLEKGFNDRSEWMIYLQVEPMLYPLYGKEKFMNLVQRMKFK
jgi:tetratricopeptide (TPR) repeat protein